MSEMKPLKPWLITLWALFGCALVVALMLLFQQPARAQTSACGPLSSILARLVERFGEYVVMTAETAAGRTFYLTRNDRGDFTVIVARDNFGCIVEVGARSEFHNGV